MKTLCREDLEVNLNDKNKISFNVSIELKFKDSEAYWGWQLLVLILFF